MADFSHLFVYVLERIFNTIQFHLFCNRKIQNVNKNKLNTKEPHNNRDDELDSEYG